MAEIPRFPSDVTSAWLAGVLSRAGEPVDVLGVDVVPVGTGQTGATYRISVTYAHNPANLPDRFVIKLPSGDDTVRDRVAIGYRSECAFYASVADRVAVPAPECFHCEISDDAFNYALLLADQSPAVQGDQIAGCGIAESVLAVRALAGLHGPTWCDESWLGFDGLAFALTDEAAKRGLGEVAKMSADLTLDRLGDKLDAADRETLLAGLGSVGDWLMGEPDRFALLHGDYRLDNLLFAPDRSAVSVVDWQTLGVGLPTRDLAYFVGTGLDPELRANVEGQLVDEYHAALAAHGVSGYDRETCWQDYRYGMIQALLIPAIGCAFAVNTERGDDMFVAMLRRACRAMRELGTLDLIPRTN
ncbi:phosphotransferase family protein [Aldersonia kunmingensis]|uniref:phosphotransferase family protein n=1 Tax=Aldersonia kunmingensis TaxID=408066 RepID=UPI0012ECC023|nr:aminoglycoside phosphotransferase family protein [Aldersonia kunmingensis]